jgi:hypothetical protein
MDDNDTYPFYVTEEGIRDLIEMIEDAYCPSEQLQTLLTKLKAKLQDLIDKRMKELESDVTSYLRENEGG